MAVLHVNMLTGQNPPKGVSFKELDSLQLTEKRPVVIVVYTSWCKYCELMKQTTLSDDSVSLYLNQQYYTLFLDAENKKQIAFNHKTYSFKPTGLNSGIHELAVALAGKEKVIYPTVYILNNRLDRIAAFQGYLTARELRKHLREFNNTKE